MFDGLRRTITTGALPIWSTMVARGRAVVHSMRYSISRWGASGLSVTSKARAVGRRMYAMGRPGRTTAGWGTSTTSEDTELSSSLRTARNRGRELTRDAAYAKRAKRIIQNNVVGSGIGLQAKVETSRGRLSDRINDDIEEVWEEWCQASHCHTGQSLHFADFERQIMGQVFEAGEVFVRLHRFKRGDSRVPLALEVIEAERIADEFQPGPNAPGAHIRMGVEVDQFGAPLAYWIRTRHPGELHLQTHEVDQIERVLAEDIIHLRHIDRWPQTRGIPWMHTVGRKLNDMDGLTEAEVTAARGSACYMGFIEPPADNSSSFESEPEADGSMQEELEPAVIHKLNPGEKFNGYAPTRPNTQLDPFMRMMLREVASGTDVSYESLSRDYSQSNYSSSRLALLDDRDTWRMLQQWFIRSFRKRVHKLWLQQAVLARAIVSINIEEYALNPRKFEAVCFKPRGWSWIDPTKEVEAYEQAIDNGFTTVSAVIAQTGDGRDLEDVLKERKRELELMQQLGLQFKTDPALKQAELAAKQAVTTVDPADENPAQETDDDPAVKKAEKMLRIAGRSHA